MLALPSTSGGSGNNGPRGYGNFLIGATRTINVLLVGRSQSGKTTIVHSLVDPTVGTSSTGFSDTRDPFFHSLILTDAASMTQYQLNMVDTPGLNEVSQTEESRRNDELFKVASKCVERNLTSLNVVCFVSGAGTTHTHDTEAFAEIKRFLGPEYSEIAMMVLTHCDEYDDEDLDEFEDNIRSHPVSKEYADYCKLGIVRFGAIDTRKLRARKPELRERIKSEILDRNEVMRNVFCAKLISCAQNKKVVSQLQKIYDDAQKEIKDRLKREKKALFGPTFKCNIV